MPRVMCTLNYFFHKRLELKKNMKKIFTIFALFILVSMYTAKQEAAWTELSLKHKTHVFKTKYFIEAYKELHKEGSISKMVLDNKIKQLETTLKKKITKDFNLETITNFLRESKVKGVRINGEEIEVSTVKPVVSGIIMYYSHKTIDCKFMVMDGKLLVIAVMDASMGKDLAT